MNFVPENEMGVIVRFAQDIISLDNISIISVLAQELGIGRTTLYKHLGTLTEQGEVVKNGNGYEPINS